jgi:hypothetical protein
MTTAVLLRSGMMGNYHVPFWEAVEEATPSLTLIILNRALNEVALILSVRGGFGDTQPVKRETSVGSSSRSPRHNACS